MSSFFYKICHDRQGYPLEPGARVNLLSIWIQSHQTRLESGQERDIVFQMWAHPNASKSVVCLLVLIGLAHPLVGNGKHLLTQGYRVAAYNRHSTDRVHSNQWRIRDTTGKENSEDEFEKEVW